MTDEPNDREDVSPVELRWTLIHALRREQVFRLGTDLTPAADRIASAIEAKYTVVPKTPEAQGANRRRTTEQTG